VRKVKRSVWLFKNAAPPISAAAIFDDFPLRVRVQVELHLKCNIRFMDSERF